MMMRRLAACVLVLSGGVGSIVGQERAATTSSSQDVIHLFDGTNLDQWRGYQSEKVGEGWVIEEGALKLTRGGAGDIMTRETFANFELTFDWKVEKGSNSGVMYRVSLGDGAPYISGPEYQILDDAVHADGKNPLTSAASIYGLYAPSQKELKPVGEWNSAKIVLDGNRLEHWLNGKLVAKTEIGGPEWTTKKEESKFKTWEKFGANSRGHIAFQDHGDVVYFRNIAVKVLPAQQK